MAWCHRVLLALILVLVVPLVPPSTPSVAAQGPSRLAAGRFLESFATDGETVAWSEGLYGLTYDQPAPAELFAATISDRRRVPVATGPALRELLGVGQGTVTWAERPPDPPASAPPARRRVLRRHLASGETHLLATVPGAAAWVVLADSHLVWLQGNEVWASPIGVGAPVMLARGASSPPITVVVGQGRVVWMEAVAAGARVYRLRTVPLSGGDATTLADGIDQRGPVTTLVVGPRWVVWNDLWGADGALTNWRVRGVPLVGGAPVVLAESATPGGLRGLAGDLVLIEQARALIALDPSTDERRRLGDGPVGGVTAGGRHVFWQQERDRTRADLLGYDLETDQGFPVSIDTGYNGLPVAAGDILVWRRGDPYPPADVVRELLVTRLAELPLPSQARRFFPQTGHTLAYGFKSFWEANGGLPVFGYPLTEEVRERDPADGRMYTVQYFERARFEYHPEHQGTPYEVELGRLGAEAAARRALLTGVPFQPVGGTPTGRADCRYLSEVGHMLCGRFLSFWRTHGLELGDPGVSSRESLALFGYPISEEYTERVTGMTVQYFERARFEHHPANPEPHTVLLTRLGAERLGFSSPQRP